MTRDRTGEPVDLDRGHWCRDGWLTGPDDDHPRRCPVCRPARPSSDPDRPVSARAAAAIARADHPTTEETR